jgi:hypothetical protein
MLPLLSYSAGGTPEVEAVLLLHWQTLTAPISLVLLIALFVIQYLKPAPLYRALLVLLAGLGIVISILSVEIGHVGFEYQIIWQSESLLYHFPNGPSKTVRFFRTPNDPSKTMHLIITGTVLLMGAALVILSVVSVWKILARRVAASNTP